MFGAWRGRGTIRRGAGAAETGCPPGTKPGGREPDGAAWLDCAAAGAAPGVCGAAAGLGVGTVDATEAAELPVPAATGAALTGAAAAGAEPPDPVVATGAPLTDGAATGAEPDTAELAGAGVVRPAGGAEATIGRGGGAALTAGGGTGRRAACWSRSACSFRSWMARSTSPGFFTPDRSILVRSPLPFPLSWRALDELRLPRWKCRRTRSASSPSSELEWVFFSLTPTSSRTSRMARLFTSSSRAKSLIRTLLIRPFYGDYPTPTLSFA